MGGGLGAWVGEWVGVEEGDWGGRFVGGGVWLGGERWCVCVYLGKRMEMGDEVIEGLGVRKWVDRIR